MMELRLVLEAVIYTLLYSAFIVVLVKRQGVIKQLYNYPPKIQQRAVELGITTKEDMAANAKKYKSYSFFDAAILDTVWFCRSSVWRIPGTEDLTAEYNDYWFHWKWFFIGLFALLPLAAVVGGLTAVIGLIR